MAYSSPVTRGYGSDATIAAVLLRGFSVGPDTASSLVTRGMGINGSIAAVIRRGLSAYVGLPATPPVGKQYKDVAGLPWPGTSHSILEGASPAIVNGDVMIVDVSTAPSIYSVVINADGTFQILTGSDSSRVSFVSDVFDVSLLSLTGTFTTWINNQVPQFSGIIPQNLNVGTAYSYILPVMDFENDTLVYSESPSSPDALSEVGLVLDSGTGEITGTPTAVGSWSLILRATDITGDYADSDSVSFSASSALDAVPDVTGLSEAAARALLEAAGFIVLLAYSSDSELPADEIVAQFPLSGTMVTPGSIVTITLNLIVLVYITVSATRVGYFGGYERQIGESFGIYSPNQYSPYWMVFVDSVPTEWIPSLRVYSLLSDIERIRVPGRDETRLVPPGSPAPR